jgi:small-conductance mechanosensitive channel
MDKLSAWIIETFGISEPYQIKISATILVLLLLYVFRLLILRMIRGRSKNLKVQYNWRKSLKYVNYGLFILIATPIWFSEFRSLGTFLGLLSAGLAIALKDPVSNFFGWIFIIMHKPFEMGDRIQIAETSGDVVDISFFQFSVMEIGNWVDADQSTGRVIYIPNGLIFTRPLYNFNQAMGRIWNEIPILITFESNWQKAKRILLDIEENTLKDVGLPESEGLRKNDKRFTIEYMNLTPTVYTKVKESGVLLTLRYLCQPRNRRGSEQLALESVLAEFSKHDDIQFAYPTTRFYSTDAQPWPK